jgi:hypothetical protein
MGIDTQSHGLRVVDLENALVLELDSLQGLWTQAQYLRRLV